MILYDTLFLLYSKDIIDSSTLPFAGKIRKKCTGDFKCSRQLHTHKSVNDFRTH